MISFSIPRRIADRLSRLGLACEDSGVLAHVSVRIGTTQVRFSATNGRVLASLIVPIDDLQAPSSEGLILDQGQLTAAMKLALKGTGNRISFKVDSTEARVSVGTNASVVRRISGAYPNVDHVWNRTVGRQWVPTTSSIDPHLVALAQKITGLKTAVLFSTPVDPDLHLDRVWASPGRDDHAETINIDALRSVVRSPAYWCDHELAILVMPITRADTERQLDLSTHTMALQQAAAQAA